MRQRTTICTFTCDRCRKEAKFESELERLDIYIDDATAPTKDLCIDCRMDLVRWFENVDNL